MKRVKKTKRTKAPPVIKRDDVCQWCGGGGIIYQPFQTYSRGQRFSGRMGWECGPCEGRGHHPKDQPTGPVERDIYVNSYRVHGKP